MDPMPQKSNCDEDADETMLAVNLNQMPMDIALVPDGSDASEERLTAPYCESDVSV